MVQTVLQFQVFHCILPPLEALQVIITFAGIISLVQAICDLQLTTFFTKTNAPNPVKVMIVLQRKIILALLRKKFARKCTSFKVKKENKIK